MLLLGRYRRPCDGAAHGSAVYILEFVTADGFLKDRRPDLISGTSEVFGRGRYLRFRAEVFSTESVVRPRKNGRFCESAEGCRGRTGAFPSDAMGSI